MKKIDFILPLVLITICIAGIIVCYNVYKQPSVFSKVHEYDYIIEVDGTDSVSVYHLLDNHHQEIGSFTSNNCDSLDQLIMEDNL